VGWATACSLLVSCLTYTEILKMEAIYSSESSVNFYRTTRCHIPEDGTLQIIYYAIRNGLSNLTLPLSCLRDVFAHECKIIYCRRLKREFNSHPNLPHLTNSSGPLPTCIYVCLSTFSYFCLSCLLYISLCLSVCSIVYLFVRLPVFLLPLVCLRITESLESLMYLTVIFICF
jgi:hypothetical protein